jgi:hypothetical protein
MDQLILLAAQQINAVHAFSELSCEQNELIHVQMERMSDVTEEENQEPMTSPLTDPRKHFLLQHR